jgi:hypothetical protein
MVGILSINVLNYESDGTLITQRLHYSPMPVPNRHVLGWYRIIRELQEANVGVICVFDGEKRSFAKQPEVFFVCYYIKPTHFCIQIDRRRKHQRMQVARGAMEADRLQRLQNLAKLLNHFQILPEDQKDRSANALRTIIHNAHVYDVPRRAQFPKTSDSDISHQANIPFHNAVSQKVTSGLADSLISRMKAINVLQDAMKFQMKTLFEQSKIPQVEPKKVCTCLRVFLDSMYSDQTAW